MHTPTIHIEVSEKQLQALRNATTKNHRCIIIIDANPIAVSNYHSDAWMEARKIACSPWFDRKVQ